MTASKLLPDLLVGFARECKARFAPTVMFFGPTGEVLAEPIVGLSRDFFGAYLEQRIQMASKAIG